MDDRKLGIGINLALSRAGALKRLGTSRLTAGLSRIPGEGFSHRLLLKNLLLEMPLVEPATVYILITCPSPSLSHSFAVHFRVWFV